MTKIFNKKIIGLLTVGLLAAVEAIANRIAMEQEIKVKVKEAIAEKEEKEN